MSDDFEPEPEMMFEEGNKINLSELKPLDIWAIIETYFRDNPNYKWYRIYNKKRESSIDVQRRITKRSI